MTRLYPQLQINLSAISDNYTNLSSFCGKSGISITPVIKGANAIPRVVQAILSAGATELATSRLEQIESLRKLGFSPRFMLIRIPALSECEDTVRLADISLQSNLPTLLAMEVACVRQNKTHEVLLMFDTGDLREGYWQEAELLHDCAVLRDSCPHLHVAGIGSLFTDYGATVPTPGKMNRLVSLARQMEGVLGYPMRCVSGGGTTSLPMVHWGQMPAGINHLRVGESILRGLDLPMLWQVENAGYLREPMLLRAQIIELRRKDSAPTGELFQDGFGNVPHFINRGERLRALLAVGQLDIGDARKLMPHLSGIEILGATSDHTILDVEECPRELHVGDILEFSLSYENMMYATASPYLNRLFITE